MRFRSVAVLSLLVVVAVACASISDNAPAQLIKPEISVEQVGGQGAAAAHVTGGSAVLLRVRVANRSSETLSLERMQFESMGMGAYTIAPQTRPMNRSIAPDHFETVELWIPVQIEDTILGANGPVTLRGIAYFDSSVGKFNQVFIQQLNSGGSGRPTAD